LPYVYLKYESGVFGKWIPISQEIAPDILRTANLRSQPANTGEGYFQKKIPKSYSEWNYSYKSSYRNERSSGDCRPKLSAPPEVKLPPPQNVELSLVESSDVSGTTADDYYKLLWSKSGEINSKKCEGISRTIYQDSLLIGDFSLRTPPKQSAFHIPGRLHFLVKDV
jgi:hypothetical protein